MFSRIIRTIAMLLCLVQVQADLAAKEASYDVIIVGAGISGLAAAQTLYKNGVKNILALEASNRIGGRIWTQDPWGSKLELGASWIHGIESNPVFEIVKNMNLTLQPTIYNASSLTSKMNSMAIYDQQGKRLPEKEVQALQKDAVEFEKYIDSINAKSGRYHTLSYMDALNDFAKKKQFSQAMYDNFYFTTRLLNTYELPADLQEMSVAIEELYKSTQVSGTNAVIPLGYDQVIGKIVKLLPVELNCKVKKIAHDAVSGVRLDTQKGSFNAKQCIVAVPLGVLKKKEIAFTPALPKEKEEAIQSLKVGLFNKVYLFFKETFWDQDVEWIEAIPPRDRRDHIFDIMNFGKYFKQPILLCFTAGSFAKEVEEWSDEKTVDSIMALLKKLYGEKIPSPSSYIVTRWGHDPNFYGSYSHPSMTSDETTYDALAKAIDNRLYFSGEATSRSDPSTVLGAFTSGQRAAKEVLTTMNIKYRDHEE